MSICGLARLAVVFANGCFAHRKIVDSSLRINIDILLICSPKYCRFDDTNQRWEFVDGQLMCNVNVSMICSSKYCRFDVTYQRWHFVDLLIEKLPIRRWGRSTDMPTFTKRPVPPPPPPHTHTQGANWMERKGESPPSGLILPPSGLVLPPTFYENGLPLGKKFCHPPVVWNS